MNDSDVNKYLVLNFKGKSNLCMVDIGAFLGTCSEFFIQNFTSSQAYAIEACPVNFNSLKNKFKDTPEVKVFNLAITDCNCQTTIHVARHSKYKKTGTSQANSLYADFLEKKDWVKKLDAVAIKGVSLSEFYEDQAIKQVDYLKINCEGCEYKVFDGDMDFLQSTDLIYLQMHSKSKLFRSSEFIKKRKNICEILQANAFSMVDGESDLDKKKKHIHQLWKRKWD